MAEAIQISLAAARVNAGLTQREAAEKLGVSNNTLVSWEAGKAVPSVTTARQLADIYQIPLDNIFFAKITN